MFLNGKRFSISLLVTALTISGCSILETTQPTSRQTKISVPLTASSTEQQHDPLLILLARVQIGDVRAQTELADDYLCGNLVPINPQEAYRYYVLAAKHGVTYAQLMAAWLSQYQFYSADAGVVWLKKAKLAKDYPIAAYRFGQFFTNKKMTYAHPKVAYQKWLESARLGYIPAMNAVADCYLSGHGVEADVKKAMYWWQLAAKHGDAYAQYSLANLLLSHQDYIRYSADEGFNWLLTAAKQGMVAAQIAVGRAYHDGVWVRRDDSDAYAWLMISHTAEYNSDVAKLINQITVSMSEKQLAKAVDLHQEYAVRYSSE